MMIRFPLLLCGLTVAAALAAASVGLAQTAPATADPVAANAALLYWRAFAFLPKLDEKQDKTAGDVYGYLKPVEDSLRPIVEMSAPALRELHRGAQQPRCVWGTPIGDGMSTCIPHAQKARWLARLAVARARWNFSHDKPAEGLDDLIDALTLARNIGTDHMIIMLFVGYTIEHMVENAMVADMNRIGPAELKRFAEKLDRLPPATTMRQAILGERDIFLDPFINDLSKPGGREKVFAQFSTSMFGDPDNDPDYKAIKKMSSEQLLEGAVGVRPFYEKMAALTELPPSEINKIKEQVKADLADPHMKETTRTLAKMILPAIVPAIQNEARQKLRLALLKAAIAVQLQGLEALSNPAYHDPFAKAAFQYEKLSGGFRLQSKTPNPRTDKPIVLEIGKGVIE